MLSRVNSSNFHFHRFPEPNEFSKDFSENFSFCFRIFFRFTSRIFFSIKISIDVHFRRKINKGKKIKATRRISPIQRIKFDRFIVQFERFSFLFSQTYSIDRFDHLNCDICSFLYFFVEFWLSFRSRFIEWCSSIRLSLVKRKTLVVPSSFTVLHPKTEQNRTEFWI